jgi:hypothetical protein
MFCIICETASGGAWAWGVGDLQVLTAPTHPVRHVDDSLLCYKLQNTTVRGAARLNTINLRHHRNCGITIYACLNEYLVSLRLNNNYIKNPYNPLALKSMGYSICSWAAVCTQTNKRQGSSIAG